MAAISVYAPQKSLTESIYKSLDDAFTCYSASTATYPQVDDKLYRHITYYYHEKGSHHLILERIRFENEIPQL